jgi:transcriptional regulator with XRE-family HTH domain
MQNVDVQFLLPMSHINCPQIVTMAISADERAFFIALGARIAELRKSQGITQMQMAETLGVSQQTINSYEVARRRLPVSALPTLADILGTTVDELLGGTAGTKKNKRGPMPKLQRQIEQVARLPKTKQKFVSEMLETVIQQAVH